MHDVFRHRESIERLRLDISSEWNGSREFGPDELNALKARFSTRKNLVVAWFLENVVEHPPYNLIIAVDRRYPWSLPIVVLPDKLKENDGCTVEIEIPHVESNGALCLFSSDVSYDLPVGIDHVREMLRIANMILENGYSGANESDYYSEANSYWFRKNFETYHIWLAEKPATRHAVYHSFETNDQNFVVYDKNKKFDDGMNIFDRLEKTKIHLADAPQERPALLIRLSKQLHPSEYPLTMGDFFALATTAGAMPELCDAISRWNGVFSMPVVIVFENETETICLGGILPAQKHIHLPGSRQRNVPLFRIGKKLEDTIKRLSQSKQTFPHIKVVSIYKKYLHDRTAGSLFSDLDACHVMIVGCGALGGQLSIQLAQIGIGKLTLLDSDIFEWQNIGRHVLDMAYIGANKAIAMESRIKRTFPDFDVVGIDKSWEDVFVESPQIFDSADLVIYVGGKTSDHLHFDDLIENRLFPSMVFGWVESFAVATHAVFRHSCGKRVADMFNSNGTLKEPVVDPNAMPPLPREPSCGAFYCKERFLRATCS